MSPRWRTGAAIVLSLPLAIFGSNYFLNLFSIPMDDGSTGTALLDAMRRGGLMSYVAGSHVVTGILLLVRPTRFAGALLQLPITIGMVCFHLSMQPAGLPPAAVMLVLNLVAVADIQRLRMLLSPGASSAAPQHPAR